MNSATHKHPLDGHDGTTHSHGLTRGEELDSVSDFRLLAAVVLNHILTVEARSSQKDWTGARGGAVRKIVSATARAVHKVDWANSDP